MKDTAFYVPMDKLSRFALVHTEAKGGGLTAEGNRGDPTLVPVGPSGGGGLFSTAMDYARFTQMLLHGGEFNGVRILAPRTVEMMRTNYVNPEPLKTMGPGLGWSLGLQVVTDAAAAGEPYTDGVYTCSASSARGSSIPSRTSRSSACCSTRTSAPHARCTRSRGISSTRRSSTQRRSEIADLRFQIEDYDCRLIHRRRRLSCHQSAILNLQSEISLSLPQFVPLLLTLKG